MQFRRDWQTTQDRRDRRMRESVPKSQVGNIVYTRTQFLRQKVGGSSARRLLTCYSTQSHQRNRSGKCQSLMVLSLV